MTITWTTRGKPHATCPSCGRHHPVRLSQQRARCSCGTSWRLSPEDLASLGQATQKKQNTGTQDAAKKKQSRTPDSAEAKKSSQKSEQGTSDTTHATPPRSKVWQRVLKG
jgi:hypothetical protein